MHDDKSTLQKCIAQSTLEAEFVLAVESKKYTIRLNRFISYMGYHKKTRGCWFSLWQLKCVNSCCKSSDGQ